MTAKFLRRTAALVLGLVLVPLVVALAVVFWAPLARDPGGALGTFLLTFGTAQTSVLIDIFAPLLAGVLALALVARVWPPGPAKSRVTFLANSDAGRAVQTSYDTGAPFVHPGGSPQYRVTRLTRAMQRVNYPVSLRGQEQEVVTVELKPMA